MLFIILINAAAFILMFADKRRAKRGAFRIPEAVLFLSAVLGGSAGAIAGMRVFRHKTKHMSFVVGLPVILICQIVLVLLFKLGFIPGFVHNIGVVKLGF